MIISEMKKYEPLWGSWRVEKFIGRGSSGSVFMISKEELGYKFISAVKVISVPTKDQYTEALTNIVNDEKALYNYFSDIVKTIVNEVNMLYKLRGCTNIVSYEDHLVLEKEEGFGWDILVRMEMIDSLPLYMKSLRLSREQIVKLGIDICTGLERCLEEGIIHRDIKEENVFVTLKGVFKLGDFGIARELSKTGRAVSSKGTPVYMAPEVYKGETYDGTVDIYSLGILLYRLLNCNRAPFLPCYPEEIKYKDNEESLFRRLSGEPVPMPLHAGDKLQDVIIKACQYDPSKRYQTPEEMKRDLELALLMMNDEEKSEYVTSLRSKDSIADTVLIEHDSSVSNLEVIAFKEAASQKIDDSNNVKKSIERIKGTQVIAVAGIMNRIGTTHTAFNISRFIKDKSFKVAVFEKHSSCTFSTIKNAYRETENKETSFTISGVDYYPYDKNAKMSDLINKGYDYLILDMGVYANCDKEEFNRSNTRILVCGSKDWEIEKLEEILKSCGITNRTNYYFTFTHDDVYKIVSESIKNDRSFKAPYNPQLFEANEESAAVFELILDEILPKSEKKKVRRSKSTAIHRNPVFCGKACTDCKPEKSHNSEFGDLILPSVKKTGKMMLLRYVIVLLLFSGTATLIVFLVMLSLGGKPIFDFKLF